MAPGVAVLSTPAGSRTETLAAAGPLAHPPAGPRLRNGHEKAPLTGVSAGQGGLQDVEPRRFELLTSALQRQRSTN